MRAIRRDGGGRAGDGQIAAEGIRHNGASGDVVGDGDIVLGVDGGGARRIHLTADSGDTANAHIDLAIRGLHIAGDGHAAHAAGQDNAFRGLDVTSQIRLVGGGDNHARLLETVVDSATGGDGASGQGIHILAGNDLHDAIGGGDRRFSRIGTKGHITLGGAHSDISVAGDVSSDSCVVLANHSHCGALFLGSDVAGGLQIAACIERQLVGAGSGDRALDRQIAFLGAHIHFASGCDALGIHIASDSGDADIASGSHVVKNHIASGCSDIDIAGIERLLHDHIAIAGGQGEAAQGVGFVGGQVDIDIAHGNNAQAVARHSAILGTLDDDIAQGIQASAVVEHQTLGAIQGQGAGILEFGRAIQDDVVRQGLQAQVVGAAEGDLLQQADAAIRPAGAGLVGESQIVGLQLGSDVRGVVVGQDGVAVIVANDVIIQIFFLRSTRKGPAIAVRIECSDILPRVFVVFGNFF